MPLVNRKQVYFSLALAFMLYLLPWAGFGLLARPDFVLLVLIFWMLRAPHLCNVGTAWSMGLLIDLASGSLFGQYALAYAMTAFVAMTYQRRLVLFTDWQQSGYVLLLLLLTQVTLLVFKLLAHGALPGWGYFLPSMSGVLLWRVAVVSRIRVASVQGS